MCTRTSVVIAACIGGFITGALIAYAIWGH
jgi:hypothetical protein